MTAHQDHDNGTLLQAVLESSPEVIVFALDPQYRYLAFNDRHRSAMQTIWGRDIAVGDCMLDVITSADDRAKAKFGFDRALGGESFVVEDEYGDSDLARLYWQNFMSPIREADGTVIGLTVFVLNITERRRAERALALREQEFRTLVEHSTDWVARHDPLLRRLYVNPALAESVPGGADALLGRTPAECPGGAHSALLERAMTEVFETRRPTEVEVEWFPAEGQQACRLVSITPEFDARGTVVSVLAVGRDITEVTASRRKIHQMAFYDSLTGLPNRALFDDRLRQVIADARWHGQTASVMMIDLDRFKAVNDTMGHAAGDQLLCEVARRLTSCVRPYDTVSRLGGDEFTVLLPDIRETDDLGRIADKIRDQLSRSIVLDGREVYVSSSIGIALFPQDSTEAADLLKFADSAMYSAKRAGRNAFRFYSAELTDGAAERLSLEIDLRQALHREQISLQYQPLVDLDTGLVIGSEALLRWQHPTQGAIAPVRFLPIAEDTGLILALGLHVLRDACRVAARRNGPGRPPHKVSVNLSPKQFHTFHFVDDIRDLLSETGCEPGWIEFDVTERLLMDKAGPGAETLETLRGMGFTIAIDDFGSGYSALSHLTRFPLDTLKMDRGFVHEATADPGRRGLIGAVMRIAECLGLRVVAEGIETAEQAVALREQGCRYGQGYFYQRPVDAETFDSLPDHLPVNDQE